MKITLFTGKTFDIKEAIGFDIKIIKSPQSRKMTLRIDAKEHIPVLTLPPRCSEKKAVDFVKSHQDWIETQMGRLPNCKKFEEGDIITLFGKEYTIIHNPEARCGVCIKGKELIVAGETDFLHRRVTDFIRKKAQEKFYKLSCSKAEKINSKINNVTIKDTKSRWGSCSTKHNLNYNWRIALAPDFVIDYLVSHEVAHLIHQNHSPAFWNCVRELCPHYEEGQSWLRVYGRTLYLYE